MKTNVLLFIGFFCMTIGTSNIFAQCPSYFECVMELQSTSSSCDYQAMEVGIHATTPYSVKAVSIQFYFTGSGPTVLFDRALSEATLKYAWLDVDWPGNGVTISGITPGGVTVDIQDLDKLLTVYFVGATPGSVSIDLTNCQVASATEVCDHDDETIPSISFSSEKIYSGTAVKQGGNDCNGFEGVLIDAHEINNKENDRPDISELTASDGSYSFSSQFAQTTEITLLEDQCYEICAYADNYDDCGLNGQDVTDTRNHVLSTTCFTNKFQYIAADVNHDERISTADVAIINAVYMGTYDLTTSSWTSWDVIEEEEFNNLSISGCDIFLPDYDNCYLTSHDPQDQSINWDVIKKGDVDGNCTECSTSFEGNQSRSSMVNEERVLNFLKYEEGNYTNLAFNPNDAGDLSVLYIGLIVPSGYDLHSVTYPIQDLEEEIFEWKYDAFSNELVLSWIDMDLSQAFDENITISLESSRTEQSLPPISLSPDEKWNLGYGNESKTYSINVNLVDMSDSTTPGNYYYKADRLWRNGSDGIEKSDVIEVISMSGTIYYEGRIESSIPLDLPPGLYVVNSTKSKSAQKVFVW